MKEVEDHDVLGLVCLSYQCLNAIEFDCPSLRESWLPCLGWMNCGFNSLLVSLARDTDPRRCCTLLCTLEKALRLCLDLI